VTTAKVMDEAMDSGTVVELRPLWSRVAETFGDPLGAGAAGASSHP